MVYRMPEPCIFLARSRQESNRVGTEGFAANPERQEDGEPSGERQVRRGAFPAGQGFGRTKGTGHMELAVKGC
jgi:hypothetical protein